MDPRSRVGEGEVVGRTFAQGPLETVKKVRRGCIRCGFWRRYCGSKDDPERSLQRM